MTSSVRRSAGNRGLPALADGGVPLILGAALACVLTACAPAAADGAAPGQAPRHGGASCRGHAPRHSGAKAYVGGQTGVAVVDLATGKAGKPLPFHDEPIGIEISPDGRTAYAGTPDSVVPIDVATNSLGRPIPVPAGADTIAIAPGGRTLYAVGDKGITSVSLRTCTAGRVIATPGISADGPLAITPDGQTAYLAGLQTSDSPGDSGTTGFLRVDLAHGTAGRFLPVPFDEVAISPDGRTAYIVGQSLFPVSLATGKPGKPIKLPGLGGSGIAITRDGHTAYVGSIKPLTPNSGLITPVDLTTGTAGRPIHVPSYPFSVIDIAVAADGRTAYVANTTTVIPVHLAAGKAGKPITLPDGAYSIALAP